MFRFIEPSSGQFLKTQYWYIQPVHALWDPILFTDCVAVTARVEVC
jgi:hypothetical protein